MKNKKGFTLVELLAVIVILSILLVIGLTAVVPLITKSQKDLFAMETSNLLEAAKLAHQSEQLIGSELELNEKENHCFTLDWLKSHNYYTKEDDTYYGSVMVEYVSDGEYKYTYWLSNSQYHINSGTENGYVVEEGAADDNVLECRDSEYTAIPHHDTFVCRYPEKKNATSESGTVNGYNYTITKPCEYEYGFIKNNDYYVSSNITSEKYAVAEITINNTSNDYILLRLDYEYTGSESLAVFKKVDSDDIYRELPSYKKESGLIFNPIGVPIGDIGHEVPSDHFKAETLSGNIKYTIPTGTHKVKVYFYNYDNSPLASLGFKFSIQTNCEYIQEYDGWFYKTHYGDTFNNLEYTVYNSCYTDYYFDYNGDYFYNNNQYEEDSYAISLVEIVNNSSDTQFLKTKVTQPTNESNGYGYISNVDISFPLDEMVNIDKLYNDYYNNNNGYYDKDFNPTLLELYPEDYYYELPAVIPSGKHTMFFEYEIYEVKGFDGNDTVKISFEEIEGCTYNERIDDYVQLVDSYTEGNLEYKVYNICSSNFGFNKIADGYSFATDYAGNGALSYVEVNNTSSNNEYIEINYYKDNNNDGIYISGVDNVWRNDWHDTKEDYSNYEGRFTVAIPSGYHHFFVDAWLDNPGEILFNLGTKIGCTYNSRINKDVQLVDTYTEGNLKYNVYNMCQEDYGFIKYDEGYINEDSSLMSRALVAYVEVINSSSSNEYIDFKYNKEVSNTYINVTDLDSAEEWADYTYDSSNPSGHFVQVVPTGTHHFYVGYDHYEESEIFFRMHTKVGCTYNSRINEDVQLIGFYTDGNLDYNIYNLCSIAYGYEKTSNVYTSTDGSIRAHNYAYVEVTNSSSHKEYINFAYTKGTSSRIQITDIDVSGTWTYDSVDYWGNTSGLFALTIPTGTHHFLIDYDNYSNEMTFSMSTNHDCEYNARIDEGVTLIDTFTDGNLEYNVYKPCFKPYGFTKSSDSYAVDNTNQKVSGAFAYVEVNNISSSDEYVDFSYITYSDMYTVVSDVDTIKVLEDNTNNDYSNCNSCAHKGSWSDRRHFALTIPTGTHHFMVRIGKNSTGTATFKMITKQGCEYNEQAGTKIQLIRTAEDQDVEYSMYNICSEDHGFNYSATSTIDGLRYDYSTNNTVFDRASGFIMINNKSSETKDAVIQVNAYATWPNQTFAQISNLDSLLTLTSEKDNNALYTYDVSTVNRKAFEVSPGIHYFMAKSTFYSMSLGFYTRTCEYKESIGESVSLVDTNTVNGVTYRVYEICSYDYGFGHYSYTYNSSYYSKDNYYFNTNRKNNNTFATAYVEVDNPEESEKYVSVKYYNESENTMNDYGILSNLDTKLDLSNTADTTGYSVTTRGMTSYASKAAYSVPNGTHFFMIKYIKDDVTDTSNTWEDKLRFKVVPYNSECTYNSTLGNYVYSAGTGTVDGIGYTVYNICGEDYGYSVSGNYYVSNNNNAFDSYAMSYVVFNNTVSSNKKINLKYISYGKADYNYGVFSVINKKLNFDVSDSSSNIAHTATTSSSEQSYTYTLPYGTSFITVKYRKSGTTNSNTDTLKFRFVSSAPTFSTTNYGSGFTLGSDGYYVSNNKTSSSYSVMKLTFTNNSGSSQSIRFDYIISSERSYDMGYISKVNTSFTNSSSTESSSTAYLSVSGESTSYTTLTIPTGTSTISIKYRKDGSVNSGSDQFKVKVSFAN